MSSRDEEGAAGRSGTGKNLLRIYLTGFMGAGKSSVGGSLADILGARFVDLDRQIERRTETTISIIFARQGEAAFRDLEHSCLKETAKWDHVVVATGGGTMTFDRNLSVIRELGVSVWLDLSFEAIVDRLGPHARRKRPLFADEDQARKLYDERLPAYRRSDLRVGVTADDSPTSVAKRIAQELREKVRVEPCAT